MSKLLLLTHPKHCILPSDEAATRASLCYVIRSGVPHVIEYIRNADSCSPDGLLPVVVLNGSIVTGYTSLCPCLKAFKPAKDIQFDHSQDTNRNMRHTYLFWMSDKLRNIMLYFTWFDDEIFNNFTCKRISLYTPELISYLIARRKRGACLKYLKAIEWDKKSVSDVSNEFESLCVSIVKLLGNGPFILERTKPSKIDALIYGYWTVFLEFTDFFRSLNLVLFKYNIILDYVKRISDDCKLPFDYLLSNHTG